MKEDDIDKLILGEEAQQSLSADLPVTLRTSTSFPGPSGSVPWEGGCSDMSSRRKERRHLTTVGSASKF